MKKQSILVGALMMGAFTVSAKPVLVSLNSGQFTQVAEATCADHNHGSEKPSEGKCGEGKCGEGKCGEKKMENKSHEGKCGEGKCGEKQMKKIKKAKKEAAKKASN